MKHIMFVSFWWIIFPSLIAILCYFGDKEYKVKKYVVRDREAGNVIERFETFVEALEALKEYERIDKEEGTYTADFYEIAMFVRPCIYEKLY